MGKAKELEFSEGPEGPGSAKRILMAGGPPKLWSHSSKYFNKNRGTS